MYFSCLPDKFYLKIHTDHSTFKSPPAYPANKFHEPTHLATGPRTKLKQKLYTPMIFSNKNTFTQIIEMTILGGFKVTTSIIKYIYKINILETFSDLMPHLKN